MKPDTGPCRIHDGPLMARRGVALSLVGVNLQQTTMVPPCCVTWCALRWEGTCTLMTVVVIRTIKKPFISTRESFQTPTKRRTGSHTVCTGAGWVSSSRELFLEVLLMPLSGFKGNLNVDTTGSFKVYVFSVDPYPREEKASFAKWYGG